MRICCLLGFFGLVYYSKHIRGAQYTQSSFSSLLSISMEMSKQIQDTLRKFWSPQKQRWEIIWFRDSYFDMQNLVQKSIALKEIRLWHIPQDLKHHDSMSYKVCMVFKRIITLSNLALLSPCKPLKNHRFLPNVFYVVTYKKKYWFLNLFPWGIVGMAREMKTKQFLFDMHMG